MEEQDPEQLLNHIFHRTNANWGVIISLRTMMVAGLPTARAALEAGNAEFIRRQLSGGERSIFIDPSKVVADLAQGLVRGMTENTLRQAQDSVDAASLIFAHSVLDGVALDYCRVTALADPGAWGQILKDRPVTLEEAKGRPFEKMLQKHLERYLGQLERESLFRKIDVIYQVCRSEPNAETIRGYAFDRGRLERLDRRRHEIIHGAALGQAIPDIENELKYMLDTANHLMVLVAVRFGLKLAAEHLKSFMLMAKRPT
jgi:hypothetical protein